MGSPDSRQLPDWYRIQAIHNLYLLCFLSPLSSIPRTMMNADDAAFLKGVVTLYSSTTKI